jgi:hypothetical protein
VPTPRLTSATSAATPSPTERREARRDLPHAAARDLRTAWPETTPFYLVVREHLESFLTNVREERGKNLPSYVE